MQVSLQVSNTLGTEVTLGAMLARWIFDEVRGITPFLRLGLLKRGTDIPLASGVNG